MLQDTSRGRRFRTRKSSRSGDDEKELLDMGLLTSSSVQAMQKLASYDILNTPMRIVRNASPSVRAKELAAFRRRHDGANSKPITTTAVQTTHQLEQSRCRFRLPATYIKDKTQPQHCDDVDDYDLDSEDEAWLETYNSNRKQKRTRLQPQNMEHIMAYLLVGRDIEVKASFGDHLDPVCEHIAQRLITQGDYIRPTTLNQVPVESGVDANDSDSDSEPPPYLCFLKFDRQEEPMAAYPSPPPSSSSRKVLRNRNTTLQRSPTNLHNIPPRVAAAYRRLQLECAPLKSSFGSSIISSSASSSPQPQPQSPPNNKRGSSSDELMRSPPSPGPAPTTPQAATQQGPCLRRKRSRTATLNSCAPSSSTTTTATPPSTMSTSPSPTTTATTTTTATSKAKPPLRRVVSSSRRVSLSKALSPSLIGSQTHPITVDDTSDDDEGSHTPAYHFMGTRSKDVMITTANTNATVHTDDACTDADTDLVNTTTHIHKRKKRKVTRPLEDLSDDDDDDDDDDTMRDDDDYDDDDDTDDDDDDDDGVDDDDDDDDDDAVEQEPRVTRSHRTQTQRVTRNAHNALTTRNQRKFEVYVPCTPSPKATTISNTTSRFKTHPKNSNNHNNNDNNNHRDGCGFKSKGKHKQYHPVVLDDNNTNNNSNCSNNMMNRKLRKRRVLAIIN